MITPILFLPRLDGAGQARKALVRKEVDRCFKEGMEEGGFILSIAGSAHEGIEPEALIEMCRYAQVSRIYH